MEPGPPREHWAVDLLSALDGLLTCPLVRGMCVAAGGRCRDYCACAVAAYSRHFAVEIPKKR